MAMFRKKPVVIEAYQWLFDGGGNVPPPWVVDALNVWPAPGGINFFPDGNVDLAADDPLKTTPHMIIRTLEGSMALLPGEWIIRGIKGELYPCKPDIFEATYEPVADSPVTNHESPLP